MPKCKGCGAEILWIETPEGKKMPVESRKVTVVLANGQVVVGYPPHWGACPRAGDFKKTKGKGHEKAAAQAPDTQNP